MKFDIKYINNRYLAPHNTLSISQEGLMSMLLSNILYGLTNVFFIAAFVTILVVAIGFLVKASSKYRKKFEEALTIMKDTYSKFNNIKGDLDQERLKQCVYGYRTVNNKCISYVGPMITKIGDLLIKNINKLLNKEAIEVGSLLKLFRELGIVIYVSEENGTKVLNEKNQLTYIPEYVDSGVFAFYTLDNNLQSLEEEWGQSNVAYRKMSFFNDGITVNKLDSDVKLSISLIEQAISFIDLLDKNKSFMKKLKTDTKIESSNSGVDNPDNNEENYKEIEYKANLMGQLLNLMVNKYLTLVIFHASYSLSMISKTLPTEKS